MKHFKTTLLTLLLTFGFLMIACSDDNNTTNPPTDDPADYFKFAIGNWWFYENDELDSNSQKVPGSTYYDTTKIVSSMMYQGKNTFLGISYYDDDTMDSSYFAIEGSKLYMYESELGNDDLLLPFGGWILMADFNQTSWTIIDTSVVVDTVEVSEGVFGKLTATIKLTGTKGTKTNITVDGQTIESQEFTQKLLLQGSLDLGIMQIPLNQEVLVKYYYGKNVGLVKVDQSPAVMTIPGFGNITVPGELSVLLKYYIN